MLRTSKEYRLEVLYNPAEVYNGTNVFKDMAVKTFEKKWYRIAIHLFDIAEKLTNNEHDKVKIYLYKSEANRAIGKMDQSRYEAIRALKRAKLSKDCKPYLNLGTLLYHENEFEGAITKLLMGGRSSNKQINQYLSMVVSTLDNCVGENSSAMFEKSMLGPTLERIKQEDLGIAPPPLQLTYKQQLDKELNLKKLKNYIANRYFGNLASVMEFFEKLESSDILKHGSYDVKIELENIIKEAVDTWIVKQNLIWHRTPLYTFYHKVKGFQTSEYGRKFEKHKKLIDKTMLVKNIDTQFNELMKLKRKKDFANVYSKMLRLRHKLKFIDDQLLPNRMDYLNKLNRIVGETYLLMKTLSPALSPEMNDLRVKYSLGVYKSRWPPLIEEVNHVYISKPLELKEKFIKQLEKPDNELDKSFLCFEIGHILALKPKNIKQTRKYCFEALKSAKLAGSLEWFLNSLFLLVTSSFIGHRFEEGQLTLLATKLALQKYKKFDYQIKFVDRALLLLQHLTPSDFIVKQSSLDTEKILFDLMPNIKLTNELADFFTSVSELPTWVSLSIPGLASQKEKAREMKVARRRPIEKMTELDQVLLKDNWVWGLDDLEPYTVKDLMTDQEKNNLIETVLKEPKYNQLISLYGDIEDYS